MHTHRRRGYLVEMLSGQHLCASAVPAATGLLWLPALLGIQVYLVRPAPSVWVPMLASLRSHALGLSNAEASDRMAPFRGPQQPQKTTVE